KMSQKYPRRKPAPLRMASSQSISLGGAMVGRWVMGAAVAIKQYSTQITNLYPLPLYQHPETTLIGPSPTLFPNMFSVIDLIWPHVASFRAQPGYKMRVQMDRSDRTRPDLSVEAELEPVLGCVKDPAAAESASELLRLGLRSQPQSGQLGLAEF